VIDLFFNTLNKLNALLIFIPGIMAMGGNSGVQTSTVTIRNMAAGASPSGSLLRAVSRELRIALTMGLLVGLLVYVVARVWTGDPVVGWCVGLAMCAAILLSAGLGAMIPIAFQRMGYDPAVASGPLITTMNDTLSLIIYFNVSIFLLHILRPGFL
jgi:magnesium transporter